MEKTFSKTDENGVIFGTNYMYDNVASAFKKGLPQQELMDLLAIQTINHGKSAANGIYLQIKKQLESGNFSIDDIKKLRDDFLAVSDQRISEVINYDYNK